jgi:hypothetical protein
MSVMRAKFKLNRVEKSETSETLTFSAVGSDKPYGPNGESEDNTFARFTPFGELRMGVTNPELMGKLNEGDVFYLDFTKVE